MPIAAGRSCRLASLALVALALAPAPASALSAEVAKKCRELAIKAHPPKPAGTTAYAQAERDYFRDCVAKEGKSQ
jgi:hypothetical protein